MTTFLLRALILLGIVCQAYGVFANPEIDIKGRNVSISSGDFSTTTDDNTNFNRQYTVGGTTSLTFTIHNTGSLPLTLSGNPSITGTNSSDFTLTATPSLSIAAGASTSFTITFDPSAIGGRSATVTINNNDADEGTYTFGLSGTGQSTTQVRWVNNEGASRPSTVTLQGVTYNVVATTYTDIQTAINAAATDDIVYITDGVYRNPNEISSTSCIFAGTGQQFNLYLNIENKGITLTSSTGNHCTSDVRLVGYGIFFDNAHNTIVQGIHLDSVRVNGFWDTNFATGSPYSQSNNLKILNNKVTNTRGHGMKTDTGGPTGIPINRGARDVIGNYFENIGFYDGRGNCTTPAPVTAMWLGEAGNGFVIANNVINNTKWAGILCDGYGGYQDMGTSAITKGAVTITGNRINNTVDAGIQIGFSSGTSGFYPLDAYITHNTVTNANTSNEVGSGGICILSSNVKGKNITNNDVSSSFNGLAIRIAGWESSSAANFTYVNNNNFYNLSGGFGLTHIGGLAPNGFWGTADNLAFYSFENNYWGTNNGPTYATNPGGTGSALRKETVAQGGLVYSTNDFDFSPYAATPNTVNSASLACCQTPSASISYPLAAYCNTASTVTVNRTGMAGGVYTVSPSGLTINGDNGTITPSSSSLGTYTVTYRIGASGGCSLFTTSTTVTIAAPPTAYNVTGGGTFCSNAAGLPVGLANSQTGVNYQLQIGGTNTGTTVAGSTGNTISFGNQTAVGTYTVVGTNACSTTMSGSVNIATIAASSVTLTQYGGITSGAGITTITQACAGTPIILDANVSGPAVTDYQWQRNGTDLIGQMNDSLTLTSGWGIYRVRITNTNNCSTNADTFAISFRSLPTAQAGTDKNICLGNSVTLGTANNTNYTYSWSPSIGLSNPMISNPTVTATTGSMTYTVYVSQAIANTGGLVCSKSDAVVVNALTSLAAPTISITAPVPASSTICEGS
ncbi:MAG: choice-of-anchor D domain-containing protein, partial [Bacteroidia bacterium]